MEHGADEGPIPLGAAVLDLASGVLTRDGQIVPVRAKTFAMLAFLALNRGRVLAKDEIVAAVWPDVAVSDDSLTQGIRDARRSIGDDAGAVIRTVPRRGYLVAEHPAASGTASPPREAAPGAVREPTVAVFPFHAAETTAVTPAEGAALAAEVTDALARFRTIAPIAPHSAARAAQDAGGDLVAAARRLGVDHLVEGTVRGRPGALSITIALTEVRGERRLWSDHVETGASHPFDAVDQLTHRISAALVHGLEAVEMERPPADGTVAAARGSLFRGIALLRSYGPGVNEEARRHLARAVELDPRSGLAQSCLALADVVIAGYRKASPELLADARDRAVRAVALSPNHPRCQRILGLILLFMEEFAAAEDHLRRALALNPYDADTLAQFGYLAAVRGRPEEGLEFLSRARAVNPLHPPWYDYDLSLVLFGLGRYAEAAEALARIPSPGPGQLMRLAACLAMDGRPAEAARRVAQARLGDPSVDPRSLVDVAGYEHAEDARRFAEALEKAIDAAAA